MCEKSNITRIQAQKSYRIRNTNIYKLKGE